MTTAPTTSDDPDDLPAGTRIAEGRFTIECRLGQGGVATVYRVRDDDGQQLALKLMGTRRSADSDQRQRFTNEWRLLRALTGVPYVVQVVESGSHDDGRPWFAMELLSGPTLASLIHTGDGSGKLHLCRLVCDVASAVADLHERGIIHRDIKPDNVIVDDDGIRLLDFGYAYTMGSDQVPAIAGLTQVEHRPGTPWYMAPEQVESPVASPSFDVYALAVSLYEVIVGRVPNSELAEAQMMARKCMQSFDELSIRGRVFDLDDDLAELVDHGLRRDPQERIGSAAELATRLAEILDRLEARGATDLRRSRAEEAATEHQTEVVPRRVMIAGGRGATGPLPMGAANGSPLAVDPPAPAEPARDDVTEVAPRDLDQDDPDGRTALSPEAILARVVDINARARALEAIQAPTTASAPREEPARRWGLPLLVVLALTVVAGGAWMWRAASETSEHAETRTDASPSSSETHPPVAALADLGTSGDTGSTSGSTSSGADGGSAPEPEPEPEPAPIPDVGPEREPEPEPEPVTEPNPRPRPAPRPEKPSCDDVEARAIGASRSKQWKKVLELTGARRCWSDLSAWAFLRVRALSELGRHAECAKLGAKGPTNDIKRMAEHCRTKMETTP